MNIEEINVNDLTIGQAKALQEKGREVDSLFGVSIAPSSIESVSEETPFKIGKCYLLRTVTHIVVGKVTAVKGKFLILEQSSWVADTGRYHDALVSGSLNEVEPYPSGSGLNFTALIDFCEWAHTLPLEQK